MEPGKKVAIIDYQLGNLFSVKQACSYLGYDAFITTEKKELLGADFAILPGVGAFADAMSNLDKMDLITPMKDFIESGKPFMGVCLGLQLLFTESEEFGSSKGLNFIEGQVKKFPAKNSEGKTLKVPQIEWNQIYEPEFQSWNQTPLKSCKNGDYMYFVHSYYVSPQSQNEILSKTTYGGLTYCSSIHKKNIFACQFHPEKSGRYGVEIYRNWFQDSANK
ncbi:MAG TPA: imidazole glycerol phosphate synthase subunit HisH [Puia sp.]|nr:imidazole glycerol phosphate synthase subunit HisH [Puia sp.]